MKYNYDIAMVHRAGSQQAVLLLTGLVWFFNLHFTIAHFKAMCFIHLSVNACPLDQMKHIFDILQKLYGILPESLTFLSICIVHSDLHCYEKHVMLAAESLKKKKNK